MHLPGGDVITSLGFVLLSRSYQGRSVICLFDCIMFGRIELSDGELSPPALAGVCAVIDQMVPGKR